MQAAEHDPSMGTLSRAYSALLRWIESEQSSGAFSTTVARELESAASAAYGGTDSVRGTIRNIRYRMLVAGTQGGAARAVEKWQVR